MMQSKKPFIWLSFIFLCTFCWHNASAQSEGYVVVGDSILNGGIIDFKTSRPSFVEFRKASNSEVVYYKVEDLTAFGYHKGAKYIVRNLEHGSQQRKSLLRLLEDGTVKVYALSSSRGNKFYLEKDSLILLSKENYIDELKNHALFCQDNVWQIPRVKLSEYPLLHYIKGLNKGQCNTVASSSYGAVTGMNLSTLTTKTKVPEDEELKAYSMLSENIDVGIFIETPIWLVNRLSIVTQLRYGKMKYSRSFYSSNIDHDVKLDLELLKFNLIPKYSFNFKRSAIYVEAGTELLYLLTQSGQQMYAYKNNNQVFIQMPFNSLQVPQLQFGITTGTGILYYYTSKHYVSLGLNAAHIFGNPHTIRNLSTTLRVNI